MTAVAPPATRDLTAIAGHRAVGGNGGVAIATLPDAPPACDGMQDMLAALFKVLTDTSRVRSESAQNQVKQNRADRLAAEAEVRAQMQRAEEEAKDGGIFNKITNRIGLLGIVGLATFNYALVAADVGLHASGLVKDLKLDVVDGGCAVLAQTHPEILIADVLLRKLDVAPEAVKKTLDDMHLGTSVPGISDEDVKPIVKTAVELNLLVAGAAASVLSAGTTTALVVALIAVALSTSAFVAEKCDAPPWLTLGLQIGGAALSLGGGFVSNTGSALGRSASELAAARAVGGGINAVNGGLSGTDTVIHSIADHEVDEANRNAQAVRNQLARLQRLLDDLIDRISEMQDSHKRASDCVRQALDTHGQTLTSTATALKA
jgi:hypothetical protein